MEINAEVECLNLYPLIKNYWSGAKQGKKWPYFSAPNTEEETTEGLAKLTLSYGPCDFDQTVKQTNCNKSISHTHTHTHTHKVKAVLQQSVGALFCVEVHCRRSEVCI